MSQAELFLSVRPQLYGIAYRILSCPSAAEDVVQDVWIRWQRCDPVTIRDPAAFLVTATTRVCLNVVQSAHCRRETHVASGFPEPADPAADPSSGLERREAVQFATRVLLERLAPAERAAFILREAFDYSFADIAQIIGVNEAYARQLLHRARKRLATGKRHTPTRTAQHQQLVAAFVAAAQHGHTVVLEEVLAASA